MLYSDSIREILGQKMVFIREQICIVLGPKMVLVREQICIMRLSRVTSNSQFRLKVPVPVISYLPVWYLGYARFFFPIKSVTDVDPYILFVSMSYSFRPKIQFLLAFLDT